MTRLDLIRSLNPKRGAEVGTLVGDFASELLTIPSLEMLHVIDAWYHFPGDYERDPANVNQGGQDARHRNVLLRFGDEMRIDIHKGFSTDVAKSFDAACLDFAFLDAMHSYCPVYRDLVAWARVAKVLLVHDYLDTDETRKMGFDVMGAVADFCNNSGWKVAAVTDEPWPTAMLEQT